jgi:hypothetical protein
MNPRLIFALLCAALAAQDLPLAGWFQSGGAVVRVWGVAGNLIPSPDTMAGEIVAALGDTVVLRDAGALVVYRNGAEVDRRESAHAGFDSAGAVTFDPWRQMGDGEELLAIGGDALLVRRGGVSWIEWRAGGTASLGAGVSRGALWSGGAALFERDGHLFYRDPSGQESGLGGSAGGVLAIAGEEWAQAGGWAIRRRGASAEKYLLPERAAE